MTAGKPLFVAVTELQRRPGTQREVKRSVALEGVSISSASVPPDVPIEIDLTIESTGTEVVVAGAVTAVYAGACRRCLNEVRGTVTSTVREIFERRPTDGETYLLAGDHVDLEQLVRDAVLLALPLAPLCADDCRGPAPEAFPAVIDGDLVPGGERALAGDDTGDAPAGEGGGAGEQEPPRDPRWAALDQLRLED